MKEHPIIMTGNSPTAILEGRKTQTRRLRGLREINANPDYWRVQPSGWQGIWEFYASDPTSDSARLKSCPYGQVGDRLWVRETFWFREGSPDAVIYKDGTEKFKTGQIIEHFANVDKLKWKPSIHMPQWASRILLEITEIRVERLQEITYQDTLAEGCLPQSFEIAGGKFNKYELGVFIDLWDSLNAKRGWETNPWVWVITFRKIE